MSEQGGYLEFAPEYDAPIPYMQRTRDYYQALGYITPYRWAHFAEVPFRSLEKPLARCNVALITTAAPYQPGKGDQGPGTPYNAAAKFYNVYSGETAVDHDLRISHVAIDRAHTTTEEQHLFPAAATAALRSGRPHRCGGAALSWSANQPQPSCHDRAGLSGTTNALPRRRCRRCDSCRQLTGVPPDRESGRPAFGRERHRHGRHGLCQGHRRVLRRAASSVQRFSVG
jgi:hypothetical protein